MEIMFWGAAGLLAWVYAGYPAALRIAAALRGARPAPPALPSGDGAWPSVSIVVAAYNEERVIRERIEDALAVDYPPDKLEVLIASDGSVDGTAAAARAAGDPRLRVVAFPENRGREAVHSDVIPMAAGEIVVLTDADTQFRRDFVKQCVAIFVARPEVGCVVGNLVYRTAPAAMTKAEGAYWRFEKWLRRQEEVLGLLHTASGPCMAIRKALFRPLKPNDDVDGTTPLDILQQGYRIAFAPEAIAYDVPPASVRAELSARTRQTSRGLVSTLRKWPPRVWVRHPALTVAIFSHKIFRWLTPFWLLLWVAGTVLLLPKGFPYTAAWAAQLGLTALALAGWRLDAAGRQVPVFSTAFGFAVANTGFFRGTLQAISGRAPRGYMMPPDPLADNNR